MPRTAILAMSFAALAAVGCRGSQSRVDAAGTGVGGGGGGAAAGRGGTTGTAGTTGAAGRGGTTGIAGTTGAAGRGGTTGTAGTTGAAGRGGTTGSGGTSGACNAANHSFAATLDAGAGPCTFNLPPPDNGQTSIRVRPDDGAGIARDPGHQNGWDYTDANHQTIQIFGPTCAAITAGTVHVVCIEFLFVSDRDAKRDVESVDRDAILQRLARLPISTWRYKSDAERTKHIGPMAQDFKLMFDVGSTDKAIYPLDESGVAFAAIQALDEKVERLAQENARLKRQIAALRRRAPAP